MLPDNDKGFLIVDGHKFSLRIDKSSRGNPDTFLFIKAHEIQVVVHLEVSKDNSRISPVHCQLHLKVEAACDHVNVLYGGDGDVKEDLGGVRYFTAYRNSYLHFRKPQQGWWKLILEVVHIQFIQPAVFLVS